MLRVRGELGATRVTSASPTLVTPIASFETSTIPLVLTLITCELPTLPIETTLELDIGTHSIVAVDELGTECVVISKIDMVNFVTTASMI